MTADQNENGLLWCSPFSQKSEISVLGQMERLGNFPDNLFGNCGQAPEVVLFFRSERNSRNALIICENLPFPGLFSQDRVKYAGWNAVQ